KTVVGLTPALRPRLPVKVPFRKHGNWKKPVGEKLEATTGSPHAVGGALPSTTLGRSVPTPRSKLRSVLVMMLNGLPLPTSITGASVQSLNSLLPRPSPPSRPLLYTPLNTKRWR